MAVLHRLLLLIIWGSMVLISLMIYGTSVSADDHSPTAGEILQNGKTLHKEVYLSRDSTDPEVRMMVIPLEQFKTVIREINYHVMYKEEYYTCYAVYDRSFKSIYCLGTDQYPTMGRE